MNKYILNIKGMRCGMCEMHVQDAVRNKYNIVKAKASYLKKELIVISELDLSIDDFHLAIDPTGYEIINYQKQEAKKGFFGWK